MNLRTIVLGTLTLLGAAALGSAHAGDDRHGHGYAPSYDRGYDNGYRSSSRGEIAIPCGSSDGAPRHCAADLRGLKFLDFQQQSRADCRRGDTFGFDARGIWVSRGCRAHFLFVEGDHVSRPNRGSASLVCASRDGRRSWCPLPRGGDVQLRRQLSRAACVRGHSWDAARAGLWVDRGCRAEFEVRVRRG
jgi:hypothetical protein